MNTPRRLLMLEDNPDDAELFRRALGAEWPGCELVHVSSQAGFRAALEQKGCDLILSDYSLPGFHGLAALGIAREVCPGVPFIFLSGAIGDEIAVESLKAGATDYVLKDRPARLVPAIRRALQEAEERAWREEAEEQLRQREHQLEQTNKDLVRSNREIQNFYHTLSHELKTPLTSAREFVAIVRDGLAGSLNETQLEYLGIALDSCEQLRVCINDLLDAARLETGKLALELKPASLGALVKRVVTTMRPAAAEKEIALVQEVQPELPEAPLDQNRMTQVISNLLDNAIRHTPRGGSIVVKAVRARARECLQVSVADTGCGISPEDQAHVFERLYQIKAGAAASEQGLGLGLYLCRELVQLHGGKIWVESQPGRGSTFSFLLPEHPPLLASTSETTHKNPPANGTPLWQRDRCGVAKSLVQ